jgi:hypothetical protein
MDLALLLEIFVGAAVVWAAWRLGQLSVLIPLQRVLSQRAEQEGVTLEQLLEQAVAKDPDQTRTETQLEIEKHGDRYYVYKKDGGFLAQGGSFEELFRDLKQRFPGENFRVPSMPQNLSREEAGEMTQTIFRVFGDGR